VEATGMTSVFALLMALASSERVPIAFWRSGDDGLSSRFYEAVDRALQSSSLVRPADADDLPAYVLHAETNVRPLNEASGSFIYKISLLKGPDIRSEVLARFEGTCTEALDRCAERVVAQTVALVGS